MTRVYIVLGILLGLVIAGFAGCRIDSVEPGNVGITVSKFGSDRGESITIGTGQVWYSAYTRWYYEFPAHMLRYRWTKAIEDDSPADESLTFTCEGVSVNVDIACNVTPKMDRLSEIFTKLRGQEDKMKAIREYVRGHVRDSIDAEVGNFKLQELYTTGREKLKAATLVHLRQRIGDDFDIEMVTFINNMRWPPKIEEAINRTIEAQQATAAAKEKVQQIIAEAEQADEKAKGTAKANNTVNASLTDKFLMYEALQRWDGKLPAYLSGNGVLPQLTVPATAPSKE